MQKLKSHSGAAKRFKRTGSGKIKRKNAYARHILTKKSSKRKRNLRGLSIVGNMDVGRIKQMLPNLSR